MNQSNTNIQPPFEDLEENMAIHKELHKYSSLPPQICHAINLLNSTKGNLVSIKKKVGNSDYYIELSTMVASNALHCVVKKVNEAQKEKSEENLAQVVYSAWQATLIMDSFNKERNFELHYLSNRETLFGIYKKVILSKSIYQEMVEYYRAIDAFNGTVKKTPITPKQNEQTFSNPMIREGVLGDTKFSSRTLIGLDSQTDRYIQFLKVTNLLGKTICVLNNIKKSQSINNQEYLQLSTRVVSIALNKVIELVNDCSASPFGTSHLRPYGLDTELYSTISEAHIAIIKMSSFDMTETFKKHFLEQKKAIEQMSEKTNPYINRTTTQRKETYNGNNGCMVLLCAIIGLVILTIYGCL